MKENVDRINFQVIKKMKVLKELSQLKLMFVELILESHALKNTIETNFKNSDEAWTIQLSEHGVCYELRPGKQDTVAELYDISLLAW